MKLKKSLVRDILRIAREKNKEDLHPEFNNYSHFTFAIYEGKILKYATNRLETRNGALYGYKDYRKGHAEFEIVNKIKPYINNKSIELVNVRLTRNGKTKTSKPCKICSNFLSSHGIKSVYYSVDNDIFLEVNL